MNHALVPFFIASGAGVARRTFHLGMMFKTGAVNGVERMDLAT
jgi:hypothetical protein